MAAMTDDDLRAAVATGILTEAQAARTMALSQRRAGTRAMLTGDDEPFELFRGFSEIFISVGLVLLVSGFVGISALAGSALVVCGVGIALCWGLALYFTRRRRMALPSIVLVCGYGLAVMGLIVAIFALLGFVETETTGVIVTVGAVMLAAFALWYVVFKVPFTMFLIGLTGLGIILYLTTTIRPGADWADVNDLFDLRQGGGLAIGTLIFGILAFGTGMAFDMRDPHRLGRMAASGFWLHLLAAPALVNTVALSFWNMGTTTGHLLLALALLIVTLLALIIDRRSFLTAGIGYMGVLLAIALRVDEGPLTWAWLLILLGSFVTLIGAFWNQTRGVILRSLPDFPGKGRLPPYE